MDHKAKPARLDNCCPTILTDAPRRGISRVHVEPHDWRSGFISRADVADFLVKQVNDASLVHKTPALIG